MNIRHLLGGLLRRVRPRFWKRRYTEFDVEAGVGIHLGRWPGRGNPVLCVHGMTANHTCFESIARSLQADGYDVYALDLRGRGKSARPSGPYGIPVHVEDLKSVADILAQKVILIGHSLGCFIAIQFAARYPQHVRALVLLDGGGILSIPQKFRALSAIRPSMNRLGQQFRSVDDYMRLVRTSGFFSNWTAHMQKFFRYELTAVDGRFVNNVRPEHIDLELQAVGGAIKAYDVFRALVLRPVQTLRRARLMDQVPYECVRCPVLILRAGKPNVRKGDHVLPGRALRQMLARFPKARAYTIQSVNHFEIVLSDHAARDQLIAQFIKSLP